MANFDTLLKKWFYQNSTQAASADARIALLDASGNPKGSDTLARVLASMGGSTFYGTCSTAATTAAKETTISNYLLIPRATVAVLFTTSVDVADATLNVSSTGAKPIKYHGANLQPNTIKAQSIATFQYDGTNYNVIGIEGLQSSDADSQLYVDMGLPSGVKWAKANIDVSTTSGFTELSGEVSPYVYDCSFFSWGNTDAHNPTSASSFSPYSWGGVNSAEPWYDGQVYGSTPGNSVTGNLSPSMDAARANLGAPWRLPTTTEFAELFNNINYIDASGNVIDTSQANKLVTMNGIVGLRLRSKVSGFEDKELFFPCSGNGVGSSRDNRSGDGLYWSSSFLSSRFARHLYFASGGVYPQYYNSRYYGFAVRPVQ